MSLAWKLLQNSGRVLHYLFNILRHSRTVIESFCPFYKFVILVAAIHLAFPPCKTCKILNCCNPSKDAQRLVSRHLRRLLKGEKRLTLEHQIRVAPSLCDVMRKQNLTPRKRGYRNREKDRRKRWKFSYCCNFSIQSERTSSQPTANWCYESKITWSLRCVLRGVGRTMLHAVHRAEGTGKQWQVLARQWRWRSQRKGKGDTMVEAERLRDRI